MVVDPYRRPAVARNEATEPGFPRVWQLVVAVLIAAPLLATAALLDRSVGDGIRSLTEDERDAFYERTLDNVRMCNSARIDDLQSVCDEQRELLREFPECDAACESIARARDACVRC